MYVCVLCGEAIWKMLGGGLGLVGFYGCRVGRDWVRGGLVFFCLGREMGGG